MSGLAFFMNEIICDRGTWLVSPAAHTERLSASQSISGLFSWVAENNQSPLNFLLEQKHILGCSERQSNSFLLIQETRAEHISRSCLVSKELNSAQSLLAVFAMASDIPLASRHLKRKPLFTR